ncbi:hypothetical protein [Faecalibacterium sp.]|uniref:InlB B-repeat-containing protein n=1 Tax=Faecalibacterium sp. TaxID=1971605 RepID=UPI0025BB2496|nr:hypothetical protein [Faecalibacterium sp.]
MIPFEGTTITKGGNYEIPEGKYAGNITVNLTDTSEPVNIAIKGGITYNGTQQVMFINVKNADEVTITNDGHEVNCKPSDAHFLDVSSGNVTVNGGTYVTATRNVVMAYAGTTTLNDMTTETSGYAVTSSGSAKVVVNRGEHTHSNTNQDRANFWIFNGGHMTLNDVTAISVKTVVINNASTVTVNGGDFKTTGSNSCFVNSSANLTINKGATTEGNFESEGASCINNNWGRVEINDGTITSDADCTIKNRGGLRMNGGTVASTNPDAAVIDCNGDFGDTQINGGTIKGGKDGILLKDLGSSEVTLKNAAFENNTQSNIHLGEGQTINIKKTFTGTATILTDDASLGRHITLENEDLSYQKKLKLFSMNPGYIIGYKRGEDGKEYRYLANANGNAVSTQDAKATADLGAGAQQLDTTDVVPEGKDVTVTADLQEGAEFLGWNAVRDDGEALDWTPARDDPQTITFTMPDCNVTVTALCQGGNGDIDNPSGGGSSDVVAGIAAVALTGAAVWGIYETGTGIYRVLNMPGVPMPSNRAGLATLIWEKAGCPEPQTVKSFSDIDDADLHLRQAASWMEEQGLMDDVKENEFRPYRYVTKLQTCLVWDKAKEKSLIS